MKKMGLAWQRIWLPGVCALALTLSGCGGKVELMAALPELEANEVLAVLVNEGIAAEKTPGKEGMVSLSVPHNKAARAIDLLREKGLPRERLAGMGEIFKKEGLISSPLEEQARYLYALSQELSATLRQVDGVLTARVHLVLPERGVLDGATLPSSAAIFIKYQTGYNLDTLQPQIRRLVSNSIPGLAADKVTIALIAAQAGAKREQEKTAIVFGIKVAQESASMLTGMLLGLSALLVVSLAGAGFLSWTYLIQPRTAQR